MTDTPDLRTGWEGWWRQLLDAWANDHRATMTALLEDGPAGVTGNEGKDGMLSVGDVRGGRSSLNDSVSLGELASPGTPPLASPAVVTLEPEFPESLPDELEHLYRRSRVQFKALLVAEIKRAVRAKVSGLEAQLQRTQMELDRQCNGWIGAISRYVLAEAELERMRAEGKQ